MFWRPFARFVQGLRNRSHHRDLWRVAQSLTPLTLKAEEDDDDGTLGLSPDELVGTAAPARFLGYYSEAGIDRALRAYAFDERLRERGFSDLRVHLTRDDAFTTTMRIYGARNDCEGGEALVSESRCRLITLPLPRWLPEGAAAGLGDDAQAVRLEWMLLQNPCASFTPARPRLPGQNHPGLGLGREVMELLRILGWRLKVAAFFINPYYVHNAILYSRKFLFFEPEDQGWYLALVQAAGGRPLQQITLAVQHGYLLDEGTGQAVGWPAHPQISPLVRPLIRLYRSASYTNAALRAFEGTRLRFDWEAYDRVHDDLARGGEDPGGPP